MADKFNIDKASLKELIDERISRLESVPNELLTVIDRNNKAAFNAILDELSKLETADGKIIASKENLARVNFIIERLKRALLNKEYVDAIKAFAGEIATQAQINDKILEKTVGTFEDDELYSQTIKNAQKNALLLLDESAIATSVLQPVSEILSNSILTSTSYLQSVEALRTNLVGENAVLTKYAGQIVKDAFAVSDRQYVQLTAKSHGIEFYRWDGGKVEDTREFCRERAGKVFHQKEIAEWGRGKNTRSEFQRPKYLYTTSAGVKVYWEGMNYDTNSATIFSYFGGYNCNHVAVPIATEYVSADVKKRAEELGYYEPVED